MLSHSHPYYFKTNDHTRIFYTLNRSRKSLSLVEPLLVFNYGLVCSNAHFEEQLIYFEKLGYQILIHDYRGHYSSGGVEEISKITIPQIAQDILDIIHDLRHQHIHMIGHSFGVNITLEAAKICPRIFKSMTLISGTVLPQTDLIFDSNITDIILPYIKWMTENFPKAAKLVLKNGHYNPLLRKFILSGGFNPKKVPDEFIQIYMQKIGELSPELFLKLFYEMKDHDIIGYIEDIKVPALIIGGDLDKIIPNHTQEIMRKLLPYSEFYIVKDGSHVPQKDFPEFLNQRLELFINDFG